MCSVLSRHETEFCSELVCDKCGIFQKAHLWKKECKISCASLCRYEAHYNTVHRNVCSECRRTFPTNHLLEIHILEWHDSMFQLLADKQNMVGCFFSLLLFTFFSAGASVSEANAVLISTFCTNELATFFFSTNAS